MSGKPQDPVKRFWSKVNKTEGCWVWTAAAQSSGYGYFSYQGRMQLAHRVVLLLAGVFIPKGMAVDHLCRNRLCVRPTHLEIVTNRENVQRGLKGNLKSRTTHCPKKHEYSLSNTYVNPGTGQRVCLICNRERNRQKYAAKRHDI